MTIDTNMMAKNEMPDEEEQQQSVDGCWCHEYTASLCSMKMSSESAKECVLLNMKSWFAQLDLVNDLLPAEDV